MIFASVWPEYLTLYLFIPLIAVLLDTLFSYLKLGRVVFYGKVVVDRRSATAPGASGEPPLWSEYLCAIQNGGPRVEEFDAEVPLADVHDTDRGARRSDGRMIRLELSIPGKGSFKPRGPIKIAHGPDDTPQVQWVQASRPTIVVSIPRLRPWKTWTLRVYTTPDVSELRMKVMIPRRSVFRGLLQKLNEHTFQWKNIGFHTETLRIQRSRAWKEVKGGWKRHAHVLVPTLAFGAFFYLVFVMTFVASYSDRMADVAADPGYLARKYLWLDAVLFLIGLVLLVRFSDQSNLPIASGYTNYEAYPKSTEPSANPSGPVKNDKIGRAASGSGATATTDHAPPSSPDSSAHSM